MCGRSPLADYMEATPGVVPHPPPIQGTPPQGRRRPPPRYGEGYSQLTLDIPSECSFILEENKFGFSQAVVATFPYVAYSKGAAGKCSLRFEEFIGFHLQNLL